MEKYSALDAENRLSAESLLSDKICTEEDVQDGFALRYTYAPVRDVIRYEEKQFNLIPIHQPDGSLNPEKPGHFNGKPTRELAEDWKNIMQHQNIRLTKDELGPFSHDDGVVKLGDGSGSYGTFAVFHGLHCVKRFHHYLYKDFYYPNMTKLDSTKLLYHTAVDKGNHQCVSWEPLENWMAEHSFDAFEPGLLMHPIYGENYVNCLYVARSLETLIYYLGDPYTGEEPNTIGIALADHPLDEGLYSLSN
ncbi:conserved hypothetical protein [Talaromyces stipitatus ATCC 10500]|uniref:Uncharacterized protein n=1 Tax=Talaromyces stipitatus (strain ATCC 10500 / CBS 375.48 / QM 6759 / NRRL 1006) TaxID=441959 RepID=B8M3A1_TALSN|nr:uncharacterized protein TSTA_095190 [Talaromyces stipitatus ATCC 10500]EED22273.1 conserved hypothetical protein [Talaromyces stipitatus ATCC 10500]